jgi:hypothetical protein
MRFRLTLILLTSIILISKSLVAQVQPFSFDKVNLSSTIPTRTFPVPDIDALLLEDEQNANLDIPYRFGYKYTTNLNVNNSGIKEYLKDGSMLWRTQIKCPEAYSVNLILDDYQMLPGSILYLYSGDKSYIIGPYTSKENNAEKVLGTDLVRGGDLIVELYIPFYNSSQLLPRITTVTYGYKDAFALAKGFGDSGSCNVNVNCAQGIDWQVDKRAIALILVNGNGFCTGAMVGNTSLDGTPYFLTANHCYSNNVASWVFRFNYESPNCTPNQNGPTSQTVSGSTLKARSTTSDFCLLELNSEPNPAYQVYYAGWNNANVAGTSGVGIHHPSADVKKISFYNTTLQTTGYYSSGSSHWYVEWSTAVTESGSSGSPIFDQNHRIVGQLHGGNSGCSSNDQSDYYGKFSTSWNGTSSSNRLRDWLDPSNSGANVLDGYFTSAPTNTLDVNLISVSNPVQYFCAGDTIIPQILFKNEGQNTITSATITYNIDGGATTTYNWNGTLNLYQQANITLPGFTSTSGSHVFNCTITNINGSSDQNTSNNTKSSNFQVINGNKIIIELKTDNYPTETSYLLKNAAGDTLLYQSNFGSANTVITKEICLEQACYTLTIYDSYGDGICCAQGNGYIKVISESGSTLAQATQFANSSVMNFCIFTEVPTANITSTVTEACQGTQLSFTQNSSNYSQLTWKLTGPVNNASNNTSYNFTFNIAGTYTLKLFAANNIGTDSVVQNITIFPKPTISLTTNPASSSSASDGFISVSINAGTAPFNYIWSNGATTQNLINLPAGTYTLTVTDSKGCTSTKSGVVTAPTSVNALTFDDGISIFPNPTSGITQIKWNRYFAIINIEVMNALGQRVKTLHFANTDNGTIDLSSLTPGMYFVQMNIGDKLITRKIMLER